MKPKLKDQLEQAFSSVSEKTSILYQRRICQLIRYHNNIKPESMTQYHIDEWLAYLVRPMGYSRSTTNQCKRAVKLFFDYIDNPMKVEMISTRNHLYIPDILSPQQVDNILVKLNSFYRNIIEDSYNSFDDNKTVLERHPGQRGIPKAQTVNKHLQKAAKASGISVPVTMQTVRQSGIVNALKNGEPWREVAKKARITENTIKKRYIPLLKNVKH